MEYDVVINVQGDEPLIEPSLIDELAAVFDTDRELQMATVKTAMTERAEIENPNNVKVVTDKNGYALYFSRSVLPYPRNAGCPVYKHIGIYAFRREVLQKVVLLPQTPLEKCESLEQLRWMENGYRIAVRETTKESVAIDIPEDLLKL